MFLKAVVGSFSVGAVHNPTVAIMEAGFANAGLDWTYLNCEVEAAGLSDAVAGAWAMGWRGFNCSMPHKQTVVPLLHGLTKAAALTNAVNCVTRTPDGWTGDNTDGRGFITSVTDLANVAGASVVIIGSGGAASAIAIELALAGASSTYIAGRNPQTANALAMLIRSNTDTSSSVVAADLVQVPAGVRMVVNATPVGSEPNPDLFPALDWNTVHPDTLMADVTINPTTTTFLEHARDHGCPIVDGTGMLVNQAAENFRQWTGLDPDIAAMRGALNVALDLNP